MQAPPSNDSVPQKGSANGAIFRRITHNNGPRKPNLVVALRRIRHEPFRPVPGYLPMPRAVSQSNVAFSASGQVALSKPWAAFGTR